jgi:hypothetical protein
MQPVVVAIDGVAVSNATPYTLHVFGGSSTFFNVTVDMPPTVVTTVTTVNPQQGVDEALPMSSNPPVRCGHVVLKQFVNGTSDVELSATNAIGAGLRTGFRYPICTNGIVADVWLSFTTRLQLAHLSGVRGLSVPHQLAMSTWQVSEGQLVVPSSQDVLPSVTVSSSQLWYVPHTTSCQRKHQLISLSSDDNSFVTLNSTQLDRIPLGISAVSLCIAGSRTLDVNLTLISQLSVTAHRFTSTKNVLLNAPVGSTATTWPMSGEWSAVASNLNLCELQFSTVSLSGATLSTTESTLTFEAGDSFPSAAAVCAQLRSPLTATVRLNLHVNAFRLTSIRGINDTTRKVTVLSETGVFASTSWALTSTGSISSLKFFIATDITCGTRHTGDTATMVGDGLAVPASWLSTPHFSVSLCAAGPNSGEAAMSVGKWTVQVAMLTSVIAAEGPADPRRITFIAGATRSLVSVRGEFFAQTVYIGVEYSSACQFETTVDSSGHASLPASTYPFTTGNLCVKLANAPYIVASMFEPLIITTLGNLPAMSGSLFAFATTDGTPSSHSFTTSSSSRSIDAALTVFFCAAAGQPSSTPSLVYDAQKRSLGLTCKDSNAGAHALCWKWANATNNNTWPLATVNVLSSFLTLTPSTGFSALSSTFTLQMRQAPSAAVASNAALFVELSASACPTEATASATKLSLTTSTNLSISITQRVTGTFHVCATAAPATVSDVVSAVGTLRTHIGTIRFFSINAGGVKFPQLTGSVAVAAVKPHGSAASVAVKTIPVLASTDVLQLTVHASDCALANTSWLTTAVTASTASLDFALSATVTASLSPLLLCAKINGEQHEYVNVGATTGVVAADVIDGNTLATSSVVGISLLSNVSRLLKVTGRNLNMPTSWSIRFFSASISSTAGCSATPARAITFTTTSVDTAYLAMPALVSVSYLGVCLSATLASGATVMVETTMYLDIIPVVGFRRSGSTVVTQTLMGVSGMDIRYPLAFESDLAASAALSFAFVAAATCDIGDVANGTALLVEGGSLVIRSGSLSQSGAYQLCTLRTINTLRRAATQVSGSMGMQVVYTDVKFNSMVPGTPNNIGHVKGDTLTVALDIPSTATARSFGYSIFLDNSDCSNSSRLGHTASGIPKQLYHVTTCGTTMSASFPAATALTTSPMLLCCTVRDPASNETLTIDTNITVSIIATDSLAIDRQVSNASNSNDGFDVAPRLVLIEGESGTPVSLIPTVLRVEARWFAVSPVDADIGEAYTMDVAVGASYIDFSNIGVKLNSGLHGYSYVLQFSVLNSAVTPVNSTFVRRGDCYSKAQVANRYKSSCDACPSEASCDGTLAMTINGQYWRPSNHSRHFYSCAEPYTGDTCAPGTVTGACREGHFGPRCSECQPGYGKTINQCVVCGDDTTSWVIVIVVVFGIIAVLLFFVKSTIDCKKSDQFPIYMKILVNHLVTAGSLGEVSAMLPGFVQEIFGWEKQASRPTPQFSALDCATGMSLLDQFVLVNCIPGVVIFFLAVTLFLRKLAATGKAIRADSISKTSRDQSEAAGVARRRFNALRDDRSGDFVAAGPGVDGAMPPAARERRRSSAQTARSGAASRRASIAGGEVDTLHASAFIRSSDFHDVSDPVAPVVADDGDALAPAASGSFHTSGSRVRFDVHGEADDDNDNVDVDLHIDDGQEELRDSSAFVDAESIKAEFSNFDFNEADTQSGSFAEDPSMLPGAPDQERLTKAEMEAQAKRDKALARIVKQQSNAHFFGVVTVVLLFFLYPTLVEWCSKLLRCDDFDFSEVDAHGVTAPDTRSFVFFERDRSCTSETYLGYRNAAIVLGVIWTVGIPACSMLFFVWLRKKLGRVIASRMFTFIIAGYRKHVWWWECVLMARKAGLIVIIAFVRTTRLQTLLAFWVVALHLVAHMMVAPYQYQRCDTMEQASLFVLAGTLNLSLLFEFVSVTDESLGVRVIAYMVAVLIILLNAGVILWMLRIICSEGVVKAKRVIRETFQEIEDKYPACVSNLLFRFAFSDFKENVTKATEDGDDFTRDTGGDAPWGASSAEWQTAGNRQQLTMQELRKSIMANPTNVIIVEYDSDSDWSDDDSPDSNFELADGQAPAAAVELELEEAKVEDPRIADAEMLIAAFEEAVAALGQHNDDLRPAHALDLLAIDALTTEGDHLQRMADVAEHFNNIATEQLEEHTETMATLQGAFAEMQAQHGALSADATALPELRAQAEQQQQRQAAITEDMDDEAAAAARDAATARRWKAVRIAATTAQADVEFRTRKQKSLEERAAQVRLLVREARLRLQRIDRSQQRERGEQERVVKEQLEHKRQLREERAAWRARRPSSATAGAVATGATSKIDRVAPLSVSTSSRHASGAFGHTMLSGTYSSNGRSGNFGSDDASRRSFYQVRSADGNSTLSVHQARAAPVRQASSAKFASSPLSPPSQQHVAPTLMVQHPSGTFSAPAAQDAPQVFIIRKAKKPKKLAPTAKLDAPNIIRRKPRRVK